MEIILITLIALFLLLVLIGIGKYLTTFKISNSINNHLINDYSDIKDINQQAFELIMKNSALLIKMQ